MSQDLKLILGAAAFAAQRHSMQRRKDRDASPYINHPLALADVLVNEGNVLDGTVIAAALLHDTVEDTETTFDELTTRFGPQVVAIVAEVTDDKSLPKQERKRLQVVKAPNKSHGAKLVKLADKICNLRDIAASPPADWGEDRKNQYFDWAKQVVDALGTTNDSLEATFRREFAARKMER
jgi:guanosine-3',5'-bis(diphosphate) 3'-pyrophosphohydrolase